MTLDTNDELLLTILLFGFRFLRGSLLSFPFKTASAELPEPNAGAWRPSRGAAVIPLPLTLCEPASLAWLLDSFGDSSMLGGTCERALVLVSSRNSRECDCWRGATTTIESFVPAVGGETVVASGLGLCTGASEGCGGGVARWRLSRSTYVPVAMLV
jgi:hypothetical protein